MMDLSNSHPGFPSLRVLVADDKPFIRSIVQNMLLRLKVKNIFLASNGEQATRLLRKYTHRIGCIISDWNMDPVGGLELLRSVRAGQIPGLPPETCFIMLTGHAKEKVVKTALALDVSAYLVKPVSFEKLVKTMDAALARDFRLRQSLYYRSISDVEIPSSVKAADRAVPPWVVWIVKSPQRAALEEKLRQIKREAAEERYRSEQKEESSDSEAIEFKNMRRILMTEVEPGCVLAEDVYADDKDLLVAAGTVLSENLLGRLKEIAADGDEKEAKLWIGDA